MIDKPMFGILHCTGEDAEKFLQGQLSADIAALTPTKGAMACYLNLKGRVIAALYVLKRPDGFWLILPNDLIAALLQKLKKFIVFSKAALIDVSDTWNVEGIQSDEPRSSHYDVSDHGEVITFCLSAEQGLLLRITPKTAEHTALSPLFIKAMFEAHIPWIGHEQSEQFLPHYINLVNLHAIAFNKGCFVGQEVVARMEYRGHLNKKLMLLKEPPADDDDIIGSITCEQTTYTLISRKE